MTKDFVELMGDSKLLIEIGFKMLSENDQKEINDNKYLGGSVSQYTLKISNLGRKDGH